MGMHACHIYYFDYVDVEIGMYMCKKAATQHLHKTMLPCNCNEEMMQSKSDQGGLQSLELD